MNSEFISIRSLTTDTEFNSSLSFLSNVFLQGEHLMIYQKATIEDFLTYYSSIKQAYLKSFCYGAFLNEELRGSTLMIEYNNPAIFEFDVPETFKKFDNFFDEAYQANAKFINLEKCLFLVCIGSDLKGVGTLLIKKFIEEFEKQIVFNEFYVEASNPVTMIIIKKVLEGKQEWEMMKINEMHYDGKIKVEFYLCKYEGNIQKKK